MTDAFTTSAPGTRHTSTPLWEKTPTVVPGATAYNARVADGDLHAIVSKENGLWHVSVSHSNRLPSWDELADARYRFTPNRARMASLLPPREEWIDLHPRTLHLWELSESET